MKNYIYIYIYIYILLIIDHKGDVLPENFWSTQPLTQMSTRVISWG